MLNNKKALGLDIGDKRIGVAISDSLGLSLKPLPVVHRISDFEAINSLKTLILENKITHVAYGLPLYLSGEESEQTIKTRDFIQKLSSHFDDKAKKNKFIEFIAIDERLSSIEAEEIISAKKLKDKKRKEAIDSVSAMIILQNYLNS